MTSPQVSEQEVEAAARAIHKIWYDKWPNPECTQCMEVARAALTAAAQVRERAAEACKHPRMNRCGTGLPSGWSRVTWNCPDCGEQGEHITPAPTEPDSGPDVLGERKGIIGNFDEK